MYRFNYLLAGAAVAALFVLIFWLGGQCYGKKEDTPSLTIAVSRTPLSAPVYIADELDLFPSSCNHITLNEVIGGVNSFQQVMNGEADFGTVSDSVIAFNAFTRNDFVNLATFVQSDNDVKIIALESSGIYSSDDLINKRVAVVKGSASEYFLTTFLALEGVKLENLKVINESPDKMQQILSGKDADAVVSWEPYGYEIIKSLKGSAKLLPTKNLYTLTFNLIAKQEFVLRNELQAECVMKGLSRAINYISEKPEKAQSILMERLKLEPDFIRWVWNDYIFKLSLNQSLLVTLNNQADWIIENKLSKNQQRPNFKKLLDPGALTSVKPSAISASLQVDN